MKRIIFTLLHHGGGYMLSRNFRLQRAGDIDWILRNYDILRVSAGIDELMILDVSDDESDRTRFESDVERLVEECFVPVTVGGRIIAPAIAERLFEIGADKVLINTGFVTHPQACLQIADRFGSQALIAGIDVLDGGIEEGRRTRSQSMVSRDGVPRRIAHARSCGAGEVLLQSVRHDGTGNGLEMDIVEHAGEVTVPLILMGGVGHADHIVEGLSDPRVDAVATANLFNFVGDGLEIARQRCLAAGVELPAWSWSDTAALRDALRGDR